MNPKLPEVSLMEFDGNKLKWKAFWASFVSSIDRIEEMQASDKLTYLKGCLKGESQILD